MNGPDHYTQAEDLLERSQGEELEWARLLVAQAHATLELAASNTATDRDLERHGATLEVTE